MAFTKRGVARLECFAAGLLAMWSLTGCALDEGETGDWESAADGVMPDVEEGEVTARWMDEEGAEQTMFDENELGALAEDDVAAGGIAREDIVIQAGCTHIVWCDEPNSARQVVCDSVDNSCSCADRRRECLSDADAVCGRYSGWIAYQPHICGVYGETRVP